MAATAAGFAPDLPDSVIHRILTFLYPKHAATTTLVSKSWFRAWSTLPIIGLDESHFSRSYHPLKSYAEIDGLAVFAKKTFRRYKHHSLRIHTFILSLNSEWYCRSGLAANWTSKALKLGATDFTFRIRHPDIVALPMHVVLKSEKALRRLCLQEAHIHRIKVVRCMGLKSLDLSRMEFSRASFSDMISCCPLIENLSLSDVLIVDDKDNEQPAGSMISLHNLTSLSMCGDASEFRKLFPDNSLVSKFSNLKDLTLILSFRRAADHEVPLIISSGSVETINLMADGRSGAQLEIDLPRIRKFTFEGSVMPKFSFRPKSRDELESRVSVINHEGLSATWFYKLSEFLRSMEGSKTRLCLHLHNQSSFDYLPGDIECSNVCEVEDLTVDTIGLSSLSLYVVLDILFRICHPKTITDQYWIPLGKKFSDYNECICGICECFGIFLDDRSSDLTLFRILEQGMEGKDALLPRQFMYGLRDLEELNAQKLCNEVWMPQPFTSLLDSTSDDQQGIFRLQLKWKTIFLAN